MNKSTIIISIVSAILLVGFLFGVYYMTNQPAAPVLVQELKLVRSIDHTKWSTTKKHVLVEFSDLQCPACKAFHDAIKSQIETDKNITGNITFVYRHFPLLQVHQHAQEAAYAAEAAGKQGKFFEYADLLFNTQTTWQGSSNVKEHFVTLAKDLKLDGEKFKSDMNANNIKQRVNDDMQAGFAAGVNATPTFYLDGEKVDVKSLEEFKTLLQTTAKK